MQAAASPPDRLDLLDRLDPLDSFLQQLPRVLLGVELEQILSRLANADELDRHVDRLVYRDDDAAASGAIELGDDDPSQRHGLRERPRLRDRVLPNGRVENE